MYRSSTNFNCLFDTQLVDETLGRKQRETMTTALAEYKNHTTSTYLRLPSNTYFESKPPGTNCTANEHKAVMQVSMSESYSSDGHNFMFCLSAGDGRCGRYGG